MSIFVAKYMDCDMKIRVAFFFENKGLAGFDCRRIGEGNPGLGGTAYMFYVVAWLLASRNNDIDVTLMTTHEGLFPDCLRVEQVEGLTDAMRRCREQGIEYLVTKYSEEHRQMKELLLPPGNKCEGTGCKDVKLIVWCHNFANAKMLRFYAQCPNVARLICVGREQMDRYRDHQAFAKSDYNFNCVDTGIVTHQMEESMQEDFARRGNIVCYIGAVIPSKGLHLLTAAWRNVLKQVPDAELYVIGNGALYGGNPKLGPWNLAERTYEQRVLRPVMEDGKLLPSVHLMGIVGGKEKFDLLRKVRVGVPNPSGETETFCISAIEMQLMGARIASKRCPGYLDTVRNGRLVNSKRELADCIVRELLEPTTDYVSTLKDIRQRFSLEAVAKDWEELFLEALPEGRHLHDILPMANLDFEHKWLKERLRRWKEQLPWLRRVLPMVDNFYEAKRAASHFLGRYL